MIKQLGRKFVEFGDDMKKLGQQIIVCGTYDEHSIQVQATAALSKINQIIKRSQITVENALDQLEGAHKSGSRFLAVSHAKVEFNIHMIQVHILFVC